MKKILLFALIFFVLIGCRPQKKIQEIERVTPVKISVISPQTISKFIKLTGTIEAEEDAIVYSKVSEKLDKIMVKVGDRVSRGQILAEQYNKTLKENINQATYALKNIQTQYNLQKIEFERMERLYKNRAISQQQFDQAKARLESSESSLEQAKAALNLAELQYENSLIKAPFDGTVAVIYFYRDQMVPVGQPVVKIVNAKNVKAKLSVPEVDIAGIRQGQRVVATFAAFPDTQFEGFISSVDKAVNPTTRSLDVEIRIDNSKGVLKSGLFGIFNIETERHENVVVVPDISVLTKTEVKVEKNGEMKELKKYYVYLVKGNKAHISFVNTGLYSLGQIELISGVNFGDTLIVMGQNIVKDGSPIKIVE
ncbi:MAG: efflux RND transporter periplasmic adaptor subunit [Chitinispirillaceae bacterium]|nr:efflux RND transporter periplasmic adaptor subunit [Chitinispirillaceae bacterium]